VHSSEVQVFMKPFRLFLLAAIMVLGLAAGWFSAVSAQEPTPRPVTADQVNSIAKQLYCPVCENIPLDVCGTTACERWREQIRDLLAEGKNESEIKTFFVDRYGDRVLAVPPPRGFNWLVYIIPAIAILLGTFILVRVFQNWHRPVPIERPPGPASPAEPEDEYIRRLEEEVRKQ
jgi:cytochrome c-type biogenesis protein CcmH